jgi:hypothetical protein
MVDKQMLNILMGDADDGMEAEIYKDLEQAESYMRNEANDRDSSSTQYGSSMYNGGSTMYGSSSAAYGPTTVVDDELDVPEMATDTYTKFVTDEQAKRAQMSKVVSGMKEKYGNSEMVSYEVNKNSKLHVLEEIIQLRSHLKKVGIDMSNVPDVDRNSNMQDIETAHELLVCKNSWYTYNVATKEFLIFLAGIMEFLFDGEREWFFGLKPDLTGWSNVLSAKINSRSYELTQKAQEFMRDNGIGGSTTLCIEIIASMVMYSKNRTSSTEHKKM